MPEGDCRLDSRPHTWVVYLQSPIRRPFMCVTVLTPAAVDVLVVSKASAVYVLEVTEDLAPQTELIEMLWPSILNSLSRIRASKPLVTSS